VGCCSATVGEPDRGSVCPDACNSRYAERKAEAKRKQAEAKEKAAAAKRAKAKAEKDAKEAERLLREAEKEQQEAEELSREAKRIAGRSISPKVLEKCPSDRPRDCHLHNQPRGWPAGHSLRTLNKTATR
jgi:hypothetical protein